MYRPSDDTFLLRSALSGQRGHSFLEIGAGNFGSLSELEKNFDLVVGTDLIKPDNIKEIICRGEIIIADSATCFRENTFDLVAFNPPYLPSEEIIDLTIDGGKEGIEVALRFLSEAIRVVKSNGKIIFLLSSHNPIEKVEELCKVNGFKLRKLKEKRLFFESIYILEAYRSQ